ncbi:MAG: UBP-type zinc finger domain-containing protein [Solirubrobacterales bacterium]
MHRGEECEHLRALGAIAEPRAQACEECGIRRMLRVCLTCGHVGCCDSANRHAREHARQAGHLLIRAWRGGAFVYCYDHGYL